MSIFSAFKTDAESEKNGIILDFGEEIGKFVVARAGGMNERYKAAARRIVGPHQRAIDLGLMSDEKARELMVECYAEAVVLGWSGVIGEDKQEIPFSKKACVELLTALPDLFDAIRAEAERISNFLQAKREADARD